MAMALPRVTAPLASSFLQVIRSPRILTSPSARLCVNCLRKQQIHNRSGLSSRRSLATAAAQRPPSLEPEAPPRNAGIPDTSIAGDETKLGEQSTSNPSISLPEAEAQVPKPTPQSSSGAVGSVASASPAPTGRPGRKSKLRPRKAAMTLTPTAVSALRELLDQPEPKLIRVGVKNRGCSGLAYSLEYVDKPGAFDEAVDQDGVKVLIDSKALFSIIGSEMDWIEDKLSRRFVFKNPNITEQCGCGESFSIT